MKLSFKPKKDRLHLGGPFLLNEKGQKFDSGVGEFP
jgi:hypothetical protein